jgi:hypothetical protein
MGKEITIEARQAGHRRRYTAEQKRALLNEAARPGGLTEQISALTLQNKTVDELVAAATLKELSPDLDRLL